MSKIKDRKLYNILTYFMLFMGSMIAAFALDCFLIPNTILDGGVTGIAIIFHKLFSIPLWVFVIFMNIPFVYIGYRHLGKNFLYRTIFSFVSFSIFLTYFEYFQPFTEEMLLATIYGGALTGIGVGLIIHFGGCIDGTESVAMVLSKKTSLSVGQIVLLFNLIIFLSAGFIFGFDRSMYSLLTYVISYKVIDFVSEGLEQAKAALIVTEKGTDLSKEIYKKLGRTTTTIKGKGLISGDKEVLYCVLTRIEVFELNRLVEEMDESAFVTILDVSDIIGNHIKSTKKVRMIANQKR